MAETQSSPPAKSSLPAAAGHPRAGRDSLTGTLIHLWPYLWPHDRFDLKMRVVWSMVLLLFAKLATLAVPFTFKWAIDALNGVGSAPLQSSNWMLWVFASPVLLTLGYGGMRILMAVLTQWRDGIFAKVAMHAVRKLAYMTFVHMHELSLRFHLERKTGGLTRVLERGRTGIETMVRLAVQQLAPTVVELALMVAVLLYQFDWRYVAITAVTVVAYMYFTYTATEWRIDIRRKMNDSDTEANTKAIDSLLNYETVKYFGAEAREAERYDRSMERYERASTHSYTSLAWLNTGQAVIFSLGITATMALCAVGIRSGTNTVGDFVMINAMMIQLYQPLNFMGFVYREIKQAIIDIEKMFGVLARNPEVKDKPGAKPLQVSSGVVRFEDVRFSYDPDRPILKGLSFEVPAGKTVAIVGPSGAGKSTISRLLFRLYDISGGRITIDGQDISKVTLDSLRQHVAVVQQDSFLFTTSIENNIAYGDPWAKESRIERASESAQLHNYVLGLPTGYGTVVGERGVSLSGGQRQRLSIARALMLKPAVMVFDDSTAAIDAATEQRIRSAMRRYAADRVTIIVAHRLSSLMHADQILFVEDGRIVERGTHEELLALGGRYKALYELQVRPGDDALSA